MTTTTAPSSTVRALAEADLFDGRITEAAKLVLIFDAQYQVDEYGVSVNEAAESLADEYGLRFRDVLEVVAGRVRD